MELRNVTALDEENAIFLLDLSRAILLLGSDDSNSRRLLLLSSSSSLLDLSVASLLVSHEMRQFG